MPGYLEWGLEVIRWAQSFPNLRPLFEIITFFGNEQFFLLFIPWLWLNMEWDRAARLSLVLLAGGLLNTELKLLIDQPRPQFWDPSLVHSPFRGLGLPSGHAQMAVLFWGAIVLESGRTHLWKYAVAFMFLLGLSRIYLGAHFPTDVLAGWSVGAFLLWGYSRMRSRFERPTGIAIVFGIISAALPVLQSNPYIAAFSGALGGLCVGTVLRDRVVKFPWIASRKNQILRYLLAVFGALLFYVGLKVVFPGEGSELYLFFRWLRYLCVGVWVTVGAPLLAKRLKLVGT